MAVGDVHVFPGFLTPVLTQLFFPKPPTTFLTCFCRGERRKYAGKKSSFNRGSNSQPPGHESDMLTTEPPRRGSKYKQIDLGLEFVNHSLSHYQTTFFLDWSKFKELADDKINVTEKLKFVLGRVENIVGK